MWNYRLDCRACGGTKLTKVFSFGKPMALANDFKAIDEPKEGFVPVEIMMCEDCCQCQTSIVVDPSRLYRSYPYVTSTSQGMLAHFDALWSAIKKQGPAISVCEIGSNTGDFLEYAKSHGAARVLGIDYAENLCRISREKGVNTICGELTDELSTRLDAFDVILARHVFCHLDDWHGWLLRVCNLAHSETSVVIEVPYLINTLDECQFDQKYLEHTSYLCLTALRARLRETPLVIQNVLKFPVHGGVVVVILKRKPCAVLPVVNEMISGENITRERWWDFEKEAWRRIARLRGAVANGQNRNKRVVGFGASAKSSVWIQACGFTKRDIAFICDNTPFKQGKLSPGTDIPIVPESELTRDKADIAINFAWQYHDEIVRKHKAWVDAGGVFINPHQI